MFRKIIKWLKAHTPTWCCCCNYLMFSKNAHYERVTTGANLPLCDKCHQKWFHPREGL
jgi:hypothetical protein